VDVFGSVTYTGQLLVPRPNGRMGRRISRNSREPQLKVNKSGILEDNFKTQLELLSQAKGFGPPTNRLTSASFSNLVLYKHQGLV